MEKIQTTPPAAVESIFGLKFEYFFVRVYEPESQIESLAMEDSVGAEKIWKLAGNE